MEKNQVLVTPVNVAGVTFDSQTILNEAKEIFHHVDDFNDLPFKIAELQQTMVTFFAMAGVDFSSVSEEFHLMHQFYHFAKNIALTGRSAKNLLFSKNIN